MKIRHILFCASSLTVVIASIARADVGPPVKITLVRETANPAESGREYSGTVKVEVGRAGLVDNFVIAGDGWQAISIDPNGPHTLAAGEVLTVQFRAAPADASKRLQVSLTFGGRRLVRSFDLSPKRFAQAGKPHALKRLSEPARPAGPNQPPNNQDGPPPEDDDGEPGPQDVTLHITGRFVYTREGIDANTDGDFDDDDDLPPLEVGGDEIPYEIVDDDSPFSGEVMYSGYTDSEGYIDVTFEWDDCDILGCDDPDMYLRFETSTAWVDIKDPLFEQSYVWSNETEQLEDFTGTEYDFGTLTPADPADFPAIHIHNSINRAHLLVFDETGIGIVHVDVLWPDGDSGAYYLPGFNEIHVSTGQQWTEGSHIHEYGHHFLENYSQTTEPDYCNCVCDEDCDTGDCTHCVWCNETDHDAWNEGWPDWLASVVLRSYLGYYGFDPRSIDDGRYTLETLYLCQEDGVLHNPVLTEGFVGALLRDIEDSAQDDHFDDPPDCTRDSLALGVAEIFDVVTLDQPTTVIEFIDDFWARFPQHENELWRTAANVGGDAYAWPDYDPPGQVLYCDSPSHPSDGGTSPFITVVWEPAPDEGSGAAAYSFVWSDLGAEEPDFSAEIDDPDLTSTTSPPMGLGDHVFSIRARDCAGTWSPFWTYRVFTVTECNSNGIVDICETDCNAIPGFCDANCGTALDCNTNGAPDECDTYGGASGDCDANGVPDECQTTDPKGWVGGVGFWHEAVNWEGGALPGPTDLVCIDVPFGTAVEVTHSTGDTEIASMGSWRSFILSGGTFSSSGNVALHDHFDWSAGTMTAPFGTPPDAVHTIADDNTGGYGMTLSGSPQLLGRTLDIKTNTLFDGDGVLNLSYAAVVNNSALSTFDIAGDADLNWFQGGLPTFNNDGVFAKVAGAGDTYVGPVCNNTGVIEVLSGWMHFWFGGLHSTAGSAVLVYDGATLSLDYNLGQHHFDVGSQLIGSDGGDVVFTGDTVMEGTYDVPGDTTMAGGTTYFAPTMDLVYLGALTVTSGLFDLSSGNDEVVVNDYAQTGGTLSGTDQLVVTAPLNWSGGTMTVPAGTPPDTVHTVAEAGMTLDGIVALRTLQRRTLDNLGVATLSDNGALYLNDQAVLNNPPGSTFDVQDDADVFWDSNFGAPGIINNGGTFVKSGGTDTSNIYAIVNNVGLIDVQSGAARFAFGRLNVAPTGAVQIAEDVILDLGFTYSNHHFQPGSSLTGGYVIFEGNTLMEGMCDIVVLTEIGGGTIDFAPDMTLVSLGEELAIFGGVLNLNSGETPVQLSSYYHGPNATLSGTDDITVVDILTWSGGTMTVPDGTPPDTVHTVAESGMTLDGISVIRTLRRRTLDNLGMATLSGNGSLFLNDAAVLNNPPGSTFDIQDDADVFWDPNFGPLGIINNGGTFTKSGGTLTSFIHPIFNNSGLLYARSGILQFLSGGLTQTDGATLLDGGTIASSLPINIHGGMLTGVGTVIGNVNTADGGSVRPGELAGIIDIEGDYTQSTTGGLNIDLGGYAAGGDYDVLNVSGTASLDGSLVVTLINGFVPQIGDQFTILTAGQRVGTFSAVYTDPSTLEVEVTYGDNDVTIEIVAVPPPVQCATCPGDMTGDDSVDGDDVGAFVACLLGQPGNCGCADTNADGTFNADDVSPFVAALLVRGDTQCP